MLASVGCCGPTLASVGCQGPMLVGWHTLTVVGLCWPALAVEGCCGLLWAYVGRRWLSWAPDKPTSPVKLDRYVIGSYPSKKKDLYEVRASSNNSSILYGLLSFLFLTVWNSLLPLTAARLPSRRLLHHHYIKRSPSHHQSFCCHHYHSAAATFPHRCPRCPQHLPQ